MEGRVEELLFNEDNSCSDCCSWLRRLRQSILDYKRYLEEEAQHFEGMFDGFRQSIEELQEASE